ncbi:hypothetical protein ACH5RR_028812 [Cinchona calisaya]|uniref:Uncharacterized protein n=1 Tax=Cinchona calisaya TaxID=153742 RepID=A0ABD2YS26_9GENT
MARGLYPSPSVSRQSSFKQQASISMNASQVNEEATGLEADNSLGGLGDLMLVLELRKKIIVFRDTLGLPPCNESAAISELIMRTLEDLKKLYPSILPNITKNEEVSLHQELSYLYEALKSLGAMSHTLVGNSAHSENGSSDAMNTKQFGGRVIENLDNMINTGRQNFDIMQVDKKSHGDVLREMPSDIKNSCPSPASPMSIPPELMKLGAHADVSNSLPPLLQAVEKCISVNMFPDTKRTAEGIPIIATNEVPTSPKSVINPETNLNKILESRKPKETLRSLSLPPIPPPDVLSASSKMRFQERIPTLRLPYTALVLSSHASQVNRTVPPTPPPPAVGLSRVNGTGPPPPPPPGVGVSRFLRLKRSISKLKRSNHMGNLYRNLKSKLEGSNTIGTTSNKIKPRIGGVASTKQGMADALAEMTKRSAYFHQIEEDVQKHSQMITELKDAIKSFKTKDMAELLKFHRHVEKLLEELSDETQVLARFEDFPTKKLESLRSAAALHLKLEGIAFNLENCKIEPPLVQLLDKVENYFNKIKGDIEALDRSKDEDSKHFRSHDIDFSFNILIRIKELMVDVSSGCMELALKERREATERKRHAYTKLLWRAFQLAFRIYTFAGGQDDRADSTSLIGRRLPRTIVATSPVVWDLNAGFSKKLIRRVQCRLKLLKNKRSTIVRQLREDVAELLKNGHGQTAFDRVDQLFKDECLLAVYDLLDQFCEFIIINLPYIRRNKDCPNDINEAVSSLIFASARFGDLPELRSIRKLFGERYGQRLATVALELLPGNLVNRQIQEKVCIKSVSDDVKSKLVEEVLRSSLQSGPLLLEYSSKLQQKMANKSIGGTIRSAETAFDQKEGDKIQVHNTEEGKIVYADLSSENKFLKDLSPSLISSKTTIPSTLSITVQHTPLNTVEESSLHKDKKVVCSARKISPCDFEISGLPELEGTIVVYDSALRSKERSAVAESSSESSSELREKMIYLDDIQEFESPLSKEGNLQDQRLFKFKSSVLPISGKIDNAGDEARDQEQHDLHDEKAGSRSFKKSKNISSKRMRRRSVSGDATSHVNDIESAIYYGESCDSTPNYDQKSHDRRKHQKKIPIKQQQKVYYAQEIQNHPPFIEGSSFSVFKCTEDHVKSSSNKCSFSKTFSVCSLDRPCYFCTCDEKDGWNCNCHFSCNGNVQIQEAERGMVLNQRTRRDATSTIYSRAMTMPPERAKDATIDSMLRSNSFPVQETESFSNRHVHPKLPDYDELAAKFMALKKANLHSHESSSG